MSRQKLVSRLNVLERQIPSSVVSMALVAEVAAELGVSSEEVLAEAEAIRRQLAEAGAHTWDDQLAYLASEWGCTIEELAAELDPVRRRLER